MVLGLLWLSYLSLTAIANPVLVDRNDTFVAKSERSLFWGWAWGTESTVSIVDRTPPISFPSRPGECVFTYSVVLVLTSVSTDNSCFRSGD